MINDSTSKVNDDAVIVVTKLFPSKKSGGISGLGFLADAFMHERDNEV